MITVNGLANALPINGRTTGEISDGFDILFTPAGYVFSIWGLIYLALIAFSTAQALPSQKSRPELSKIRPWYVLNAAANAGWILAWHHERFAVSWLLMLIILGSLVAIYTELARQPSDHSAAGALFRSAFSLYLGWISVATIANTTVVASIWGCSAALASPTVTLGILAFATVICVYVSLRFADPIYAAVFVWAQVGIGVKHGGVDALRSLHLGAFFFAALCLVVMVASFILKLRRRVAGPLRSSRSYVVRPASTS
jgi:hypothetical protein